MCAIMTPRTPHPRLCAITAVLLALASAPVFAQTAGFDDLRALRYYLQQNDTASTQAELRRLRIAFPDWQPPSDLNAVLAPNVQASVDEGAIWRQIERRDYNAARQLIEQGRQAGAGWSPSAEMLRVLETNEAQENFDTAVTARNASNAIAIARRSPSLMTCERINNAWLLADMYVLADQKPAAMTTYRNTLQSCQSYAQMQPTLEKSSAIATRTELQELFGVARRSNPGAASQLDQLETRLLGGAAPAQSTPMAAAATPPPAAPSQPSAAPVASAPARAPVQAAPNAGALPLRGDGRLAQTRRLKEQEQFASCLAASTAPRSLDVLYERSWCAYSHDRPTEALIGFQAAARAGDALGPNVRRDAHFGLALSYLSMNMTEQAAHTASQVRLSDTQHRELEGIVPDQRGVRAYRAGDFRQAIGHFDALETLSGALRRDLAMLRAYAYLNSGQRPRARAEFERLHSQLATAETREGLNATQGP
ncbi:hypothetical protein BD293_2631 [Roseinatronobacter monicus]|uniref:Tetratricopeptide repeat protein n=2 Tax=Roseinatronobacter monicus TaxID=393481 RepID=A0A543KFW6_9RHOB|nr:hypothetical protein BD293_2631 [Roseinatronobacter monicus]